MKPKQMPLTDDEKLKFKKIFEDLSLSTIEGIYHKKFGKEFEAGREKKKKDKIIQELLNAKWSEEEKKELIDYYLEVLRKSKPVAAYILKVEGSVTWKTIEDMVKNNKANLSQDPITPGFVIDDPDEFRFSYWYPYVHGFFTDTGNYVKVTYPVLVPFKIDFERNLLYIEDSIPYKFIKGVSILKNTLSLKSILKEGMSEEDINMRFKKFLDDIRAILIIKQAISAQRENTKKIRRRTPPQDSENQVINVDEFVRKSFLQRLQKISESEREFYLSLIELKYRKESQQEPISYLLNLPLPAVVKVKDVFSIKDVDIDVSDIEIDDIEDEKLKEKLSGIDDLVRIELKGDRDIFENETVKAYITAGGRIVGISGLLHYGIGVYEFSLKHGVNFNIQEVPGYIKVKRKGKEIIESDEEREELENVFNLLLALYVHTFIS